MVIWRRPRTKASGTSAPIHPPLNPESERSRIVFSCNRRPSISLVLFTRPSGAVRKLARYRRRPPGSGPLKTRTWISTTYGESSRPTTRARSRDSNHKFGRSAAVVLRRTCRPRGISRDPWTASGGMFMAHS